VTRRSWPARRRLSRLGTEEQSSSAPKTKPGPWGRPTDARSEPRQSYFVWLFDSPRASTQRSGFPARSARLTPGRSHAAELDGLQALPGRPWYVARHERRAPSSPSARVALAWMLEGEVIDTAPDGEHLANISAGIAGNGSERPEAKTSIITGVFCRFVPAATLVSPPCLASTRRRSIRIS
jgi:hypothetical protein